MNESTFMILDSNIRLEEGVNGGALSFLKVVCYKNHVSKNETMERRKTLTKLCLWVNLAVSHSYMTFQGVGAASTRFTIKAKGLVSE